MMSSTGDPSSRAGVNALYDLGRSRDLGAARDWLSCRYSAHELICDRKSAGFQFAHASVPVRHGTANLLQYGSAVEIEPEAFSGFYMLEMPLTGGADLSAKGAETLSSDERCALFLPPQLSFSSRWRKGTRQFMLKLNARDVQMHWRYLLQDQSAALPQITPVIDFSNDEGWRVQQTMLLLKAEFERGLRSGRDTITTSPLSTTVLDTVLDYIRVHHRDCYAAEAVNPLPAPLVRCMVLIRERMDRSLTIEDLTAAAGISERSLFSHFSEFLGTTPMRYLEARRLERARMCLISGKESVESAARKAGFRHMGRFSGCYQKAFGELPSETVLSSGFSPE